MTGGVLVAYDRSPQALQVADGAYELAQRLGDRLVVVHAVTGRDVERFQEDPPPEGPYVDVLFERVRQDIRQQLASRLGRDGRDTVRVVVMQGDPEDVVVKQAKENEAAYLVVGVRSRSKVGKLVFGSTAQSIILRSPCPVVCVPVAADSQSSV